jgi:hypothetical protein
VVQRGLAAAQAGVVDDVVVDQRRRVDELHHRAVGDLFLPVVAEEPGGEQQQRGPDPLAAALRDVLAGGLDERHVRVEVKTEDGLRRHELVGDQVHEAAGHGRADSLCGVRRVRLGVDERLVLHQGDPIEEGQEPGVADVADAEGTGVNGTT